ncbi:MAG TPA: FlgO family outer membrane protein [Longimicrobiales bacterium]|nr:FlgO family outer membrane protein [Longimicrobiales bacterium]
MRTRGRTLALLLSLVAPAALSAQDDAATTDSALPVVAVIDFNAFSLSLQDASAVGKGVAGMLITELSDRQGMQVVERQEINSVIQEAKLALSGRVDESTAMEVGRLVGARYLITGVLGIEQTQVRMDVRIFEVETSEILEAMKFTGKPDDFLQLVVDVADAFSRDLKLPTPERHLIASIPVQAVIAYSRGEAYEQEGKLDEAREQYGKAIELAKDYKAARQGLDRVNAAIGADQ